MLPLDSMKWISDMATMLKWAREADKTLSKYRLALEEIAAFEICTIETASEMIEIAQEALR